MDVRQKLLDTKLVLDNEYLDRYVRLIESNSSTKKERFKTQSHHIIPRNFFKFLGIGTDNSKENLVNLKYEDHLKAHLFLSMCSIDDKLSYENYIVVFYLNKKYDFRNLGELQKEYEECRRRAYRFNPMFDPDKKMEHDKIMRSSEVREKISKTMKEKALRGELFSEEHKRNISIAQKEMVYIFRGDKTIRVKKDKLQSYLDAGWNLYKRRSYDQLCGREQLTALTDKFNRFDTRSIGVYCILDTGERFDFKSIRDATIWWFYNFKPFGEHFAECVLQRKIKKSISGESIIYNKSKKEQIPITNIRWYKEEGGDAHEKVNTDKN